MNNEETICQPLGKDEMTQIQKESTEKSGEWKKTASTVGGAFTGGVTGAAAATVGVDALHNKEDKSEEDAETKNAEEPAAEDKENATAEAVVDENRSEPIDTKPQPEPQPESKSQPQPSSATTTYARTSAAAHVSPASNHESSYANHNGAGSMSGQPQPQTAGHHESDNSNNVQVLGVYGEHGQALQTAVLTDGEYVAAVVDIDGNGIADVMAVDINHDQQIGEGEVFDITSEHVQMVGYERAYNAQQHNDAPVHQTHTDVSDNGGENDVRILGMYEAEGENGETMRAAVFRTGEDVSAVVDVNGDGKADVLMADFNGNQRIDEDEIVDISSDSLDMNLVEQAYIEQQQAESQDMNTYICGTLDEQPDSGNDMGTLV